MDPQSFGAQEKTRTSTALRPLAPEASASTNSATWAGSIANIIKMSIVNTFDTFIVESNYRDGFQLQNALFNWLNKEVAFFIF